jgi:hypothetical protein
MEVMGNIIPNGKFPLFSNIHRFIDELDLGDHSKYVSYL